MFYLNYWFTLSETLQKGRGYSIVFIISLIIIIIIILLSSFNIVTIEIAGVLNREELSNGSINMFSH